MVDSAAFDRSIIFNGVADISTLLAISYYNKPISEIMYAKASIISLS